MEKIKLAFIAVFTAIGSSLGILAIPVLILVFENIVDYITGLAAAPSRAERITSYKSFRGIVKKVCQWLLIFVGAMLDWLLISTGKKMGISIPFDFVISIGVAVWLIFNETISILENMLEIGVKIPPFLMPLVKNLKKQIEDKANITEGENKEGKQNE